MSLAVYNYLAVDYARSIAAPATVHKKSELRHLYNSIVRISKKSPLYKITPTYDLQNFALGIKESSLKLNDMLDILDSAKQDSVFTKVKAQSQDESCAEAFLVTDDKELYPQEFSLEVHSLAREQINTSDSFPSNELSPLPGSYGFQVELDNTAYKFQYKIPNSSSNEETLKKLASFINKANINLDASVRYTGDNMVYMEIASEDTGNTGEPIFKFRDISSPEGAPGLIAYLNLNHITQESDNAQFSIDGEEKQALSNSILLNKALQVNFTGISTQPVSIGYIPDSASIMDELDKFREEYNHIIDLANSYHSRQGSQKKLLRMLQSVSMPYANELEASGISFDEEGRMEIDTSLAREAVETKEINSLFSSKGFIPRLAKQYSTITINPMEYVDKILITYPNVAKPGIAHPYVTSIYSGMLFNYYC